jgi:hypothetical protein
MADNIPAVQQDSFLTLLNACEDGALVSELNDRVRDLVATMAQEGMARGGKPKGGITVSFSFALDQGGIMEVSANVAVKEPKTERSRTIFYRLKDNTLSPNNPKQITMDLAPRHADAPQSMKIVS